MLATGYVAEGIAVDATSVYWVNCGSPGGGQGPGSLMKVAIGGGTPETLASLEWPAGGLAIDGTNAYVTIGQYQSYGAIVRVPLTGGPVTVLASGQNQPQAIAVDATSVYWSATANDPGGYDAANTPILGGVIRKLTPK